jgi:hypothetical protein
MDEAVSAIFQMQESSPYSSIPSHPTPWSIMIFRSYFEPPIPRLSPPQEHQGMEEAPSAPTPLRLHVKHTGACGARVITGISCTIHHGARHYRLHHHFKHPLLRSRLHCRQRRSPISPPPSQLPSSSPSVTVTVTVTAITVDVANFSKPPPPPHRHHR